MKIVINCYSSSDENSFGCDYALLDLTPDTAQHLLSRHEQFMKFHAETDAYEAYWFDTQVDFFSPWGNEDGDEPPSVKESEEVALPLEACDEYTPLPDAFVIPEKMLARTECNQVIACEEGIRFFCYPRATNVSITTRTLPPEFLRQAVVAKEG